MQPFMAVKALAGNTQPGAAQGGKKNPRPRWHWRPLNRPPCCARCLQGNQVLSVRGRGGGGGPGGRLTPVTLVNHLEEQASYALRSGPADLLMGERSNDQIGSLFSLCLSVLSFSVSLSFFFLSFCFPFPFT